MSDEIKLNYTSPEIESEETSTGANITQPFRPSDISIDTPPMNLGDVVDMLDAQWINLDTEYQREMDLWGEREQSRLIESALLGLRLPAFYFDEVDKRQWNIIDGLQRCCAINNFCVKKTLHLRDLEFLTDFEGKSYDDLNFETRRDLRMLHVTVHLLKRGTPDRVKYVLFKRLNTGGLVLRSQEIRNAMYYGRAITAIAAMAKDEAFLLATGNRVPTKRCADMDFVSRFAAFYCLGYDNYRPDLDDFINAAMERIRDALIDSDIEAMQTDFHAAMIMAYKIFGTAAFRKQDGRDSRLKPINKAYFEVIATAFAKMSEGKRQSIIEKKGLLVNNLQTALRESKTFNDAFSGGTAKPEAVRRRFEWFNQIVDHTYNNHTITIKDDKQIDIVQLQVAP